MTGSYRKSPSVSIRQRFPRGRRCGHDRAGVRLHAGLGRSQTEEECGTNRPPTQRTAGGSIPRIARLLALAIRMEGLLRSETIRDYAELARLGRVTRARMTQIMQLLNLAPDIQEEILFLLPVKRLNERNLRTIVSRLDWHEQRLIFQKMLEPLQATSENPNKVASGGSPRASVKPKVPTGSF